MLPQLATLRLIRPYSEGELVLCLSTLVHTQTHTVELSSPFTDSLAAALTHMQLTSCPGLQTLVISRTPDVLPLMGRFTYLRTLVYDVPEETVDELSIILLSRLPYLQGLRTTSRFTADSFRYDVALEMADSELFFPALEELTLEKVGHLQTLSRILSLVRSPSMHLISVAFELSEEPRNDMQTLSRSLSGHSSLTTLHLINHSLPNNSVIAADFTQLTLLNELREVYLHDVMSDENISAHSAIPLLTSSWTQLRSLQLLCSSWEDPFATAIDSGVHAPSIRILPHLATNCPRLDHLCLAIRVDLVPDSDQGIGPRNEQSLRLVLSPFSNISSTVGAYNLGVYISDIYPSISIVYGDSDASSALTRARGTVWTEVGEWASKLAVVRASERRRTETSILKILDGEAKEE